MVVECEVVLKLWRGLGVVVLKLWRRLGVVVEVWGGGTCGNGHGDGEGGDRSWDGRTEQICDSCRSTFLWFPVLVGFHCCRCQNCARQFGRVCGLFFILPMGWATYHNSQRWLTLLHPGAVTLVVSCAG